jgi:hypothetical protein
VGPHSHPCNSPGGAHGLTRCPAYRNDPFCTHSIRDSFLGRTTLLLYLLVPRYKNRSRALANFWLTSSLPTVSWASRGESVAIAISDIACRRVKFMKRQEPCFPTTRVRGGRCGLRAAGAGVGFRAAGHTDFWHTVSNERYQHLCFVCFFIYFSQETFQVCGV